jgi:hypothetical protein
LNLWPDVLRAIVQTHGAAAVNEAGLQTLGYPGILAIEEYETRAIREFLKGMDNVHI